MYTPEEYLQKLRERIKAATDTRLLAPVITNLQQAMDKRIFETGLNSKAQKLGAYSTKPMYVTQKQFANTPAFRATGKVNTEGTFKNKRARRSMYLPQGYKQLRQVQGMPADKVNLTYSGSLRKSFNQKPGADGWQLGTGEQDKKKLDGLAAKYGPRIFKPTDAERETAVKQVVQTILETLKK
jgi:hypothetical protein